MEKSIKITMDIKITEDLIETIIVGALEGGSNYWLEDVEMIDDKDLPIKNTEHLTYSEFMFKELIKGNRAVITIDCEEETKILTLPLLIKGIKQVVELSFEKPNIMLFSGCSLFTDGELDGSNFDSGVSDAVIQFAIFNELVYG